MAANISSSRYLWSTNTGNRGNPERSISTPVRPHTMANSSTTNGTNSPTTVNSAGTQPLNEWKCSPYETFNSMKSLALTMMPPSGTNVTMVYPPSHKPSKFRPITNNTSSHGTPPSLSPRSPSASQPARQLNQPSHRRTPAHSQPNHLSPPPLHPRNQPPHLHQQETQQTGTSHPNGTFRTAKQRTGLTWT